MAQKKIVLSVTNDLVTDQRVHKIATFFLDKGLDVTLVGRFLPDSLSVERAYHTKRFKLWWNKGALFYANYNFRLFFHLLRANYDIYYSNDLDSLSANYLSAKIKGKTLIFDSHEYFTEVPELVNRKLVKNIWLAIEKSIVPKLKYNITVSPSIAQLYLEKYGVPFTVVRNVPTLKDVPSKSKSNFIKASLKISETDNVIVYQGAINMGRGIELLIEAMLHMHQVSLLIIGMGDIFDDLVALVNKYELTEKVKFTGKIPFEKILPYTLVGDIGCSLEEDLGLNYRYALPNKLFDYLQAGLPVIVSNLPDMASIVNSYNTGMVLYERTPEALSSILTEMLSNTSQFKKWQQNALNAAKSLNWNVEKEKLNDVLRLTQLF